MPIAKQQRINELIRVREVRVVGQDGSQLGIMRDSGGACS